MTNARWTVVAVSLVFITAAATVVALEILADDADIGEIPQRVIHSRVLGGETREYVVHLPENYDREPTRRYPVLYALDASSQSLHTAESAALMARIGAIPPIIVVGVLAGEMRNRDYTPPYMRIDVEDPASPKGSADHFLNFLREELILEVEREFRTERPRMLSGWSRSGLFTFYSLSEPALFDARFAHSTPLWREDDAMLKQLTQAFDKATPPRGFFFVSIGDNENEGITGAFHRLKTLLQTAPSASDWHTYISVNGKHQTNPRRSTPVGLCAFLRRECSLEATWSRKPR